MLGDGSVCTTIYLCVHSVHPACAAFQCTHELVLLCDFALLDLRSASVLFRLCTYYIGTLLRFPPQWHEIEVIHTLLHGTFICVLLISSYFLASPYHSQTITLACLLCLCWCADRAVSSMNVLFSFCLVYLLSILLSNYWCTCMHGFAWHLANNALRIIGFTACMLCAFAGDWDVTWRELLSC